MMMRIVRFLVCGIGLGVAAECGAGSIDTDAAARRGEAALFTRCFSHPLLARKVYDGLWQQWGLAEKPAKFDQALLERYGLHAAEYPNAGLPMGLRPVRGTPDSDVGLDCMLCHAGSLFGKPVIGLPNTSLDLAALFDDFAAARRRPQLRPYRISNVRGTTESTATAIFLSAFRDADLNLTFPTGLDSIPDQLCEDAPALWLLRKKRTMYHNGQIDARAVRPLMSFMLSPLTSGAQFKKLEPTFADMRDFLLTLEAPRYPFPIDAALAARGQEIFEDTCARCHGTYGAAGRYPNKIIPLNKIGTDPTLVRSLTPALEQRYRASWFAQGKGPNGQPYPIRYNEGYQAPPLDGVWATAPYFHNGSVPTIEHVLNSETRPRVFTRSYRTAENDFDPERVGWKTTDVATPLDPNAPEAERRRIYDTTQPGRGNGGHRFGDRLATDERRAVVEYLKTL